MKKTVIILTSFFASIFLFLSPRISTPVLADDTSCPPHYRDFGIQCGAQKDLCCKLEQKLGIDLPTCERKPGVSPFAEVCDPNNYVSVIGKSGTTEALYGLPYTNCQNGGRGIDTAIGCIPTGGDLSPFLGFLLRWALGVSGGIILLMLIATGYALLTSSGNPEKLQAVKENLVSIFSGLILIGFSLLLLQTIGAGILKLPTF